MENTNKRHAGSQPEEGKRRTCGGNHPYHAVASERDCCPCVGMLRQQESRNLKIYKILTCPQAPQVSPMRVLSLRGKRNVGSEAEWRREGTTTTLQVMLWGRPAPWGQTLPQPRRQEGQIHCEIFLDFSWTFYCYNTNGVLLCSLLYKCTFTPSVCLKQNTSACQMWPIGHQG